MTRRLIAVLILALAAAGCSSYTPGEFISIDPPSNWETGLRSSREARDDFFRVLREWLARHMA